MQKPVGIGVIGTGDLGNVYSECLNRLEKARLIAVADIIKERAKRLASSFNIDWYADYRKLLERDDIEAVFIVTPPNLHAEQAIASAEAGKHVLITKPIADTLKNADMMIKASRETNVIMTVAHFMRFKEDIKKLKALIEEGEIGRVFLVNECMHLLRPSEYWKWGTWRGRQSEAGGGVIMTNEIHALDYYTWMFGPVSSVVAETDRMVQSTEVEDVASVVAKFRNGIHLNLNASTSVLASKAPYIQVFGTEGTAVVGQVLGLATDSEAQGQMFLWRKGLWRDITPKIEIPDLGHWKSTLSKPWLVGLPVDQGIKALLDTFDDFLTAVVQNGKPLVSLEEARNALEFVHAIYQSAREGRRVFLPLQ